MREGKARVLKPNEFEIVLKVTAADAHQGLRNVAMLYLSYGAGLRVGEIASLNIGHVIADGGKIAEEFVIEKSNTKTDKSRTVYLTSKKVRDALAAHVETIQRQPDGSLPLERSLFLSHKGHRMGGNALQQVFARLYRTAGFTGCKSHSGRRTFATRLDTNGADLKSIKQLMGHENVKQTETYVDSNPERLRGIAAKAV